MRCGGAGGRGGDLPLISTREVGTVGVPVCAALLISCAPEARVACRGIGGVRAPGRNPVAVAVGVVTQVRSSPHHLRLTEGRAGGILARTMEMEGGGKPVRTPLPNVARDVVESEAVGRKGGHRGRAQVAVLQGVVRRVGALPDVAAPLTIGCQFVAPRVALLFEPATGCILPLGLRR